MKFRDANLLVDEKSSFTYPPSYTEAVIQRCSVKKVFLEISQNSQENACARISFLVTLLKKRPWHWCFPVNFTKFLRTPFYLEHLWWLLLHIFCLHFLRIHHDYVFQRVFESVRAQFLSGNISGLLVIYLFNYNSSKSAPY